MGNKDPLVTIVALCYNHEPYVIETLESILLQSYKSIELIIIDDASKDNSVSLVTNFIEQRQLQCKYIAHEKNRGICRSLNESLLYATGKYYKVIACDDRLLPDCITTLVTALEESSNDYAMVYADVVTINEYGQTFGKTPFQERGWLTDEDVPSGKLFVELAKLCFIPAPSVLMKTNIARELKFDETLFFEDWDMWLRTARQYLIKGIVKPVVQYRIHSQSMFQDKSAAFIQAALLTAEKNMGYNKEADNYFKKFIADWSLKNYFKNGPRQLYWFWKRFQYNITYANFYKVIRALLGIQFKRNQKSIDV
jgi:glycosyltransferase involved in cell wall biosynthesis